MMKLRILFTLVALLTVALVGSAEKLRKFKEIELEGKTEYLKRKGKAWNDRCRLVGIVSNAPETYHLTLWPTGAIGKDNKPVLDQEFNGDISVFESGWLTPGTYKLVIKAEGYDDFTVKKVPLKAQSDYLIRIMFGRKVYNRKNN